jgi:hypothetical protein
MNTDLHPMRGEPNRAHALFESYLALGPRRSLPMLARTGVASLSYLKKLSARWQWKERAAAWQQQLSRSSHLSDPDMIAEARERHLRDAVALQQLAKAQIRRWLAKDPDGALRLNRRLTPHQVMRLWHTGLRVEHELLPAPEPEKVEEYEKALEHQRDRDETAGPSSEAPPRLPKALADLLRLAHEVGVERSRAVALKAKLCRWLWLPQDCLSDARLRLLLRARKKAKAPRRTTRGKVCDGR